MKLEEVLDLNALRASADHSPHIERLLVLLFMGTAERCLARMQGLVVHGDSQEWRSTVHELKGASTQIHAKELAMLCKQAVDVANDAIGRMAAYFQIKAAYEGLLIHLRNENLLLHTGKGG